jgi:hypothetical protein
MKENNVFSYVKSLFPQFKFIYEKRNGDMCKYDLYLSTECHIIIIEIDENQDNIDTVCDNERLLQLSDGLRNKPIVLIRFNPDGYDNVSSCWCTDSVGQTILDDTKVEEWQSRLDYLHKIILYYHEGRNHSCHTLLVHSLYFNTKKSPLIYLT